MQTGLMLLAGGACVIGSLQQLHAAACTRSGVNDLIGYALGLTGWLVILYAVLPGTI